MHSVLVSAVVPTFWSVHSAHLVTAVDKSRKSSFTQFCRRTRIETGDVWRNLGSVRQRFLFCVSIASVCDSQLIAYKILNEKSISCASVHARTHLLGFLASRLHWPRRAYSRYTWSAALCDESQSRSRNGSNRSSSSRSSARFAIRVTRDPCALGEAPRRGDRSGWESRAGLGGSSRPGTSARRDAAWAN